MSLDFPGRANVMRGRSLNLYLVDGTPSGVIIAEFGLSSVLAVVASRTALPDLVRRDEASRTGVYLLMGPDPDFPGRQSVYIGEGDQVKTRLIAHDTDASKDFFTRAVLVVSKDKNLTKAHGRYLESRLIAAVRDSGRAKLANGTEPPFKGLPEAQIADMERLLAEVEVLLPVLGFDILTPTTQEPPAAPSAGTQAEEADAGPPIFEMEVKARAIDRGEIAVAKARAIERGGEFVVLSGSTALTRETPGIPQSTADKRKLLLASGLLMPDANPELYRFAQDSSFGSPSGASAAIAGRADRGTETWRDQRTGLTYASWRAGRINAVSGATPESQELVLTGG